MSRRPARYTQAEIRRATEVAKAQGMAVRVADDGIWIVPVPGSAHAMPPVVEARPQRVP